MLAVVHCQPLIAFGETQSSSSFARHFCGNGDRFQPHWFACSSATTQEAICGPALESPAREHLTTLSKLLGVGRKSGVYEYSIQGGSSQSLPKTFSDCRSQLCIPSPEKTSSTFNSREGKWKRHSTFSVVEAQSARSSFAGRADDKENTRPGHIRDLWSLNDPRKDDGGHDENDDSREFMGDTSASTSFTFSAYCRPSTASSRAQSQVGNVVGERQDEDDEIEILRTDSNGRRSKNQRSHAFGSDDSGRTMTEADESSEARSVNDAEIVNVTAKWVNGQRPQAV